MATDMRSLSRAAKFDKRIQVIELRRAGCSYAQIALQLGLSRTGVFDICKRHDAAGIGALRDAPGGRGRGAGRTLAAAQELQLRQQIIDSTPDQLAMPEALWSRAAVARLIERQLGIVMPVRTLALYLDRWGYTAGRQLTPSAADCSLPSSQWLTDRYPLLAARSKAEGGEISWGSKRRLLAEDAGPARSGPRGLSMISAVTNRGQLRWLSFKQPLDAPTLIDFLCRLSWRAKKKVFLIMDDLRVRDDGLVQSWLVEHEDAIEAFHLPASRPAAA